MIDINQIFRYMVMDIDYQNSTICCILINVTTVLSFGKVLLFKVYLEPDSKHMYHIITAFNKIIS